MQNPRANTWRLSFPRSAQCDVTKRYIGKIEWKAICLKTGKKLTSREGYIPYKSQNVFWMKTSTCRDVILKNQPDKMGMIAQYFHTILTSCAILPTTHTTKLTTCTLPYCYLHPPNKHGTQHSSLHSLPHKNNPYLPCPAAIQFHNNLYSNIAIQTSIGHALHSFCIQNRPCLPCTVATTFSSHPQYNHNSLCMDIKMYYTTSTTGPIAFHIPSLHTTNKHKAYLCKWQSIVVSFPSCLVGLWGFHPYMHLFSFRKLFCDLFLLFFCFVFVFVSFVFFFFV